MDSSNPVLSNEFLFWLIWNLYIFKYKRLHCRIGQSLARSALANYEICPDQFGDSRRLQFVAKYRVIQAFLLTTEKKIPYFNYHQTIVIRDRTESRWVQFLRVWVARERKILNIQYSSLQVLKQNPIYHSNPSAKSFKPSL